MQLSLTNQKLNSLISSKDESTSVIHIWGDVGVGKSTLCYSAALAILAQEKKVIYISTKSYFKENRFHQISKNYPPFNIYNFLLYNPTTFSQQTEVIMNLEFLILEEIRQLKTTSVGLIVVDGVSILWHLEMTSDASNQKTLRALNTLIATLDYIRRTYNIPVIITNRSVIRTQENRNFSQPASNAVMDYWGKIKIKIELTENPAMRDIILESHSTKKNLPKRISTKLIDSGFN
jgi:DNA repair protein RadB